MKGKYWYFITTEYCVICGREVKYRTIKYSLKPKNWNETHETKEFACHEHFI